MHTFFLSVSIDLKKPVILCFIYKTAINQYKRPLNYKGHCHDIRIIDAVVN